MARRSAVVAHGQLGHGAAREPARHLDGSLAEGPRTDRDRPAPVLQGAGQELGRAHGPAVDEDDDGALDVAPGLRVQRALLPVHVVRGDQAAVQEGGGGGDGLGDEPTGVAAQVQQHTGAHAAPSGPRHGPRCRIPW